MSIHPDFVYTEDHSVIGIEYLDQLVQIREDVEARGVDPVQTDAELMRLRGYARARIPKEYWSQATPLTFSRAILPTITQYLNNSQQAMKHGLGLTLFSTNPVYKLHHIYSIAMRLVGKASCFIVTYNELIFWLKGLREDIPLKRELDDRFRASFFFLIEIPDQDEISASIKQEFMGRLEARRQTPLPTLFTVNSSIRSLDEIFPNSFLGRILLPFSAVNKSLFVEELLPIEQLHEQKWKLLDD